MCRRAACSLPLSEVANVGFVAGSENDEFQEMEWSSDGKIIAVGNTYSSNFPITPDAYDKTLSGERDMVLMKFDHVNWRLDYCTYIGGGGGSDIHNAAMEMVVDDDGDILVLGVTESDTFPTTANAYDREHNGRYDTVLMKFGLRCYPMIKLKWSSSCKPAEKESVWSVMALMTPPPWLRPMWGLPLAREPMWR